jgi:hypothetical protein
VAVEPWIERLTVGGAGLPLPLAFTAVLEDLIDNGDSDQASLIKIIQKSMSFKEDMVTTQWGTWGSFGWDILATLKGASVIEEYGMASPYYRVTPWLKQGEHHVIIPDPDDPGNPNKGIGVVVHGKQLRRKRNLDSKALMDLKALIASHPEIDEQALKLLRDAVAILGEDVTVQFEPVKDRHRPAFMGTRKMRAPEDQVDVIPKKKRRAYRGGRTMTEFFRGYIETHDEWFTIKDVAEAWNRDNPDFMIEDSDHAGSMRKTARELLQQGVVETRMKILDHGERIVNHPTRSTGVRRHIRVQTAEYRRMRAGVHVE